MILHIKANELYDYLSDRPLCFHVRNQADRCHLTFFSTFSYEELGLVIWLMNQAEERVWEMDGFT